jgi:hypothetical protein
MAFGLLRSPNGGGRVKATLIGIPTALALFGWAAFMGLSGDPLAILHTTEWSGMYTLPMYFIRVLPAGGLNALSFPVAYLNVHWLLPLAVWSSAFLLPLSLRKLWEMNRSLGIYSLAYLAGVFAFGAAVSAPRFLAVLFPMWLPLSEAVEARRWALFLLIAGFVLVCGMLWVGFLRGIFVG